MITGGGRSGPTSERHRAAAVLLVFTLIFSSFKQFSRLQLIHKAALLQIKLITANQVYLALTLISFLPLDFRKILEWKQPLTGITLVSSLFIRKVP